jgi:UPF0755 protein
MKKILAVLVTIGMLCVGAGVFLLFGIYPQHPNALEKPVEVTIPSGSGAIKIAHDLEKAGVISYPQLFRLLAVIQEKAGRFQAGEYAFLPRETPQQVIEKLSSGNIILRQITIPEGKTSAQIVERLRSVKELTGTIEKIPAEGSFLPNTYRYTKGESRASIIARMQEAMASLEPELWDKRASDLPIKNWKEAVTLASIVEKETGVGHERGHVAGLYLNRLRIGMLLQADPTVAYGVYGGQFADKPLRRSDLKRDTAYNSYLHPGLPPTPICNPGREAIAAVLNPKKHDDLYMVATGNGGHYFAKTNVQHLQNVKKYRQWQRKNGRR